MSKETEKIVQEQNVATIQLKGEPYQTTVNYRGCPENVDANISLNKLSQRSGYKNRLNTELCRTEEALSPLFTEGGFYTLDRKLKHGENLSFNDAFSLISFVCAALNNPLNEAIARRIKNLGPKETHLLQATALLAEMSAKESYRYLTPEEIAGMVAATVCLDTVVRVSTPSKVVCFGGMGGDKGFPLNGENSKLFSLSTLSALGISVESFVHKHHSYPNTSKVAGQSAIEACGARSDFNSPQAIEDVQRETNLIMTSCHNTRTLHTLSHLLRGETVNHVIGPLAFPIERGSSINAVIGVNEKIHPETISQALEILDKRGIQRFGNSCSFFGTSITGPETSLINPTVYYQEAMAKEVIAIDEVAPPPYLTIVSFFSPEKGFATFFLHPEDFYSPEVLAQIKLIELEIPNKREEILYANSQALAGIDRSKTLYLAMTMGLVLFTKFFLDQPASLDFKNHRVNSDILRLCTKRALEILCSGEAMLKLKQYVAATQKYCGY